MVKIVDSVGLRFVLSIYGTSPFSKGFLFYNISNILKKIFDLEIKKINNGKNCWQCARFLNVSVFQIEVLMSKDTCI